MEDEIEKEQEKEQQHKIIYKIMPDIPYRVFVSYFGDRKFYKIQINQKEYDGTITKYYKQVHFKKGIDLENETEIIIEEAYENLYENKKDKYNPISTLNIIKFRMNNKQSEYKAINDYYQDLSENEELEITDDFLD